MQKLSFHEFEEENKNDLLTSRGRFEKKQKKESKFQWK